MLICCAWARPCDVVHANLSPVQARGAFTPDDQTKLAGAGAVIFRGRVLHSGKHTNDQQSTVGKSPATPFHP